MNTLANSITFNTSNVQENIPEHWIARVVRQMKGCSPARIDSVIQANLPVREIKLSQRPDTLEIPGLKGYKPYSVDNLPNCYELGYFKDNALLHPEIPVEPQGIKTEQNPLISKYDNVLCTCLIVCFLLLSLIIHNTRSFLRHRTKEFFNKPRYRDSQIDAKYRLGIGSSLANYLLLSVIGGILVFCHAQHNYNLFMCHISEYQLLAMYIGMFILFFGARKVITSFINWIFFSKTNRHDWEESYNYLLILESTFLLPVVALEIFINPSSEITTYTTLAIIAVAKIMLLIKTFTTFSFKFYGILHLLSYLCALEIIPLAGLVVLMISITSRLIITYY